MANSIFIGIDTGTYTGLAVWDGASKRFLRVETMHLHRALECVRNYSQVCASEGRQLVVVFEDARQRKWIPRELNVSEYRGKLMGAGSVKRDAVIWQEFLDDYKIRYENTPPRKGLTKLSPDAFARLTGWTGRTSNHARDAAMLVFQR